MDIEQARDSIYEAALVPERWDHALTSFSRIGEGMGAVLFAADATSMRWRSSPELHQIMEEFLQGCAHRNTRAARMLAAQHPGFVGELEVFTQEEIEREPVYNEFLHPRGMGWGAATAVAAPTGDQLVFAVERTYRRGPFEKSDLECLDRLRPDLCRATMIAARIGLERARATAETLESMGFAAVVVSARKRAVYSNRLMAGMAPTVTIGAFNGLQLSDPRAQTQLTEVLANLDNGDPRRLPLSIPVRDANTDARYVAHVVPVRGLARDLFLGATACIVFTKVGALAAPSVPLLIGLFDLTAAEARITVELAAGKTPAETSQHLGLSPHTVKSHIKSIFQKTGVRRQPELMSLVDSLSPIPF